MPNTFTTTTTTGYGSRIGKSVGGVVAGVAMFIGSFGLLYWNEGRTDLSTVAKTAMEMPSASADVGPEFQGTFVSTSGTVTSEVPLGDGLYLLPGEYLAIDRTAEMYAWIEKKTEKTQTNTGGSETTTTTYDYAMGWTADPMATSEMQHPEEHENPGALFASDRLTPSYVRVGAIAVLGDATLPSTEALTLQKDLVNLGANDSVTTEYVFHGTGTLTQPQIGDMRVRYAVLKPGFEGTAFGMMSGKAMDKYTNEEGDSLFRVFEGSRTAAIATLHQEHVVIGWALRMAGFLLMWLGLAGIFGPLSTLLDVLPFLGGASRFVVSLVTLPVAFALSLVTILVSMVLHSLVAVVIAILVLIAGGILIAKRFPRKAAATV